MIRGMGLALLSLSLSFGGVAWGSEESADRLQPLIGKPAAEQLDEATARLHDFIFRFEEPAADTWERIKVAGVESTVQVGAPLLAKWIVVSREQATADGTRPIPRRISAQLVGFFPEELLDRARYRVGWERPHSIQMNIFHLLDTRAVSLGDVIVFRDEDIAADPVIWAHELAHIQQYERWGIEEFARRYIRDHHRVELEAWEATARFKMWVLQQG